MPLYQAIGAYLAGLTQSAIMHVANVKHSHCEAKFCRVWAKFGRVRRDARRIWASTPQELRYYEPTTFEKPLYFRGILVCSEAIYRLHA